MLKVHEFFSIATQLAYNAAIIINQTRLSPDIGQKWKGVDDPVTMADIKAQTYIVNQLHKQWPTLKIIGEESTVWDQPIDLPDATNNLFTDDIFTKTPNNKIVRTQYEIEDLCVWVDPLDGTLDFVKGEFDNVTTLIGVSYKKEALMGVISQPFSKVGEQYEFKPKVYFGHYPQQRIFYTYDQEQSIPFELLKSKYNPASVRFCTQKSRLSEEKLKIIQSLGGEVLQMGGSGKKSLTILEGKADLFIYLGTCMSKWDICAPEALVRAFGVEIYNYVRDIFWGQQDNNINMIIQTNHLTIPTEVQPVFTMICFRPTLPKQQACYEIINKLMGNDQIKPTVAHSPEWTFIKEIKQHPQFGPIKVYRGPNDQLQCLKTVIVEESTYKEQMESLKKMIIKDCTTLIGVNRLESQKQEEFCSNYVKIYLTADYSDQIVKEIRDVKKFIIDVSQALDVMDQKGINNCQFCVSKVLQFGERVKVINTQLFTEISDYESLYMQEVSKQDWMIAPEVMQLLKMNHPPSFNSQQAVVFNFGIMLTTLLTGVHPLTAEIYNYKELELTNKFDDYVDSINRLQISNNIKQIIIDCLNKKANLRPSLKDIIMRARLIEIPLQVSHLKEEDLIQNNQVVSFNPCYDDVKKVLCDSNINKNLDFHNSSPTKNEKPLLTETQQCRKSKQIYNLENTYNSRQSVQNKQMQSTASMKGNTKTKQPLQQAKSPNKKPKMMRAHHYK